MAYNLIITPEAADDVTDACIYYESVQNGLSERFLSELLATYHSIIENPQYYSFISAKSNFRDVKIKKFPYVIIFDINDNIVTVYSVFHTSRKPKYR